MKCGAWTMLVAMSVLLVACAKGDGGPISGEYCATAEPAKCTTISFPPKRGTEAPGTMLLDGKRYEVSWMETESEHRKYLANLPGGTVAFEMSSLDAKSVVIKWRGRPDQTYALK